MGRLIPSAILGLTLVGLGGCGCGAGGGDDGVSSTVNDQMSNAAQIAKQVDGDYSKMTPEQQQVFLKLANNDPKQAANMAHMIAHPPSEKYQKKN